MNRAAFKLDKWYNREVIKQFRNIWLSKTMNGFMDSPHILRSH